MVVDVVALHLVGVRGLSPFYLFMYFLIEPVQPSLTNLLVVMGRVPMWKGVWGSEPIIILESIIIRAH